MKGKEVEGQYTQRQKEIDKGERHQRQRWKQIRGEKKQGKVKTERERQD